VRTGLAVVLLMRNGGGVSYGKWGRKIGREIRSPPIPPNSYLAKHQADQSSSQRCGTLPDSPRRLDQRGDIVERTAQEPQGRSKGGLVICETQYACFHHNNRTSVKAFLRILSPLSSRRQ